MMPTLHVRERNVVTSKLSYEGKPIHIFTWLTSLQVFLKFGERYDPPTANDLLLLEDGDFVQIACNDLILWARIVARIDKHLQLLCKPVPAGLVVQRYEQLPFDMADYFLIHHQHVLGFKKKNYGTVPAPHQCASEAPSCVSDSMSKSPQTNLS